ncbi:hypothetical protein MP638_004562 [Amoeboaphelidium occidentale]|nr:hypothetical protein MP638_004562 [Amoeboaphelidium occidentale]
MMSAADDVPMESHVVLTKISELKEQGNKAFGQKKWKDSVDAYSGAIQLFCESVGKSVDQRTQSQLDKVTVKSVIRSIGSMMSSLGSSNDADVSRCLAKMPLEQQLALLQPHVLYANRSAAFCHLKMYEYALLDAQEAVQLNPAWPKSQYRTAEALFHLRRFDEALVYFYRALTKYSESNGFTQSSRTLIQQRIDTAVYALQDQTRGFRIDQLLCGRDIAAKSALNPIKSMIFQYAESLQNFVYLISCNKTRKTIVVDFCWDLDGLISYMEKELPGYELCGAIVTHYHFDHVGGIPPAPFDQYRIQVDGIASLMKKFPKITAYIHTEDVAGLVRESNPGLDLERVFKTYDGFELRVGDNINIKFMHTPGHTPGSQCFLLNEDRLFTGDTVFINSVGRLDFPDSDSRSMFSSLQTIKALQGEIQMYAGHDYGGPFSTLETEKNKNPLMNTATYEEFIRVFNRS